MTPQQIQQLQKQLGIPVTGIMDNNTVRAYNNAVSKAVAADPNVKQYGGSNDTDSIVNAYQTGDWTGVTSLSGQPFTPQQQQAAVQTANKALAPAYNAQVENDTETTRQALAKNAQDLENYNQGQRQQFSIDKQGLDTDAASNGVLYAGSRAQLQDNLANKYNLAARQATQGAQDTAATDTRNFAYQYGAPAAKQLSSLYNLPGATTYNASTAAYQPGSVNRSTTLSALYNPGASTFQGTAPAAQSSSVQTRAASLLANNANKLSLNGYSNSL